MEQFVRQDLEAMLKPLVERRASPTGFTESLDQMFDVRDDGLYIAAELRKDRDAKVFEWSPACELDEPDAPNPLVAPSLPFPFTARELAAFFVDGIGAHLAEHYGLFDPRPTEGDLHPEKVEPDEGMMDEMGDMAKVPKRALRQAFAAYREAADAVGARPFDLEDRALALARDLQSQNRLENIWQRLYEHGISDEEREARRDRARSAVYALRAESIEAANASQAAYRTWRKAVVQWLLLPPVVDKTLEAREHARLSRWDLQDAAILDFLIKADLDPTSLPAREKGKSGPKAAASAALLHGPLFRNSASAFKASWERLRKDKRVAGAE